MQNFAMKINKSPFKNVYWFARALVKYGSIRCNRDKQRGKIIVRRE